MSLSQVRQYFRDRIREVDSSFIEHDDAFNIDNIPQTKVDKTYHINMSSINTLAPNDISIEDNFSVVLTFHSRGFRETTIEAHDALLDFANCVRLNSLQPLKIAATDNIRSLAPINLTTEPIEASNDNTIRMSLEFNVRLFYKITDFSL